MKYIKPHLSDQAIIQLMQTRGLVIDDIARAKKYINNIGYYRFSVYLRAFQNKFNDPTHGLMQGTNFDDVLKLYIFDRKLRLLVIEAIERIEVSLRAEWSSKMVVFTNDTHAYMDVKNFYNPKDHAESITKIQKNVASSREDFIIHYKKTYTDPILPPIWAMVETLSFGELSSLYKNTKNWKIKHQINATYQLPKIKNGDLLTIMIEAISLIRNVCAHHGRLWNRITIKQLGYDAKNPLNAFYRLDTDQNGNKLVSRVPYNYFVAISYLMKAINPNSSWQRRFVSLVMHESTANQCNIMGFPSGWCNESIWK